MTIADLAALPSPTRVYQNHHLDSTRWEVFEPRASDIIVTTSYKSGTTWTQMILAWLLHGDEDAEPSFHEISPWVDARFMGISKEALRERLDALEDRRFLKSHLPLDGLPYHPEVRYIVVGRDPRDVFMSLFNHYRSYTDIAMAAINSEDIVGPQLPPCPEDPAALFREWISRGWFEWESEGWPFWSNLHHTQSYWTYRHLPNFLFLHYNDMLADLPGAVRRIAEFAEIDASEDLLQRTTEATTFSTVKRRAMSVPDEEDPSRFFFEGGQKTFFHKGTNERWRGVLGETELALYERTRDRVLTPECARWLEGGGAV